MRHGLTITWVTRIISKEALHVELGFKKILFHQNLTKLANIADRINFHVVNFTIWLVFTFCLKIKLKCIAKVWSV